MEPLRLAARSIVPDHLPVVDAPTEAVQLIFVWVDDIRHRGVRGGRVVAYYQVMMTRRLESVPTRAAANHAYVILATQNSERESFESMA